MSLQQQQAQGEIKIYYFDGSGFGTASSLPYAWQAAGQTREIPRKRSKRLNVLGFMSRDNDAFFHTVEGSVNSARVIEAFDGFAARYAPQYERTQAPCIVILDNASVHHAEAVRQRANDWMRQGVFLHFLPSYSPELNLIEILWRKIKYEWLPLSAYKNYQAIKEAVLAILNDFGSKYTITFV
jgi:hypothetical protein